jgi:hypothetical protein
MEIIMLDGTLFLRVVGMDEKMSLVWCSLRARLGVWPARGLASVCMTRIYEQALHTIAL